MSLFRTFLISFIILSIVPIISFAQETLPISVDVSSSDLSSDVSADTVIIKDPNRTEYYRSNSNGLSLVEIDESNRADYKYVLRIDFEDNCETLKTLYRNNSEIKRWEYVYKYGVVSEESYIKEGVLSERYYYDRQGHKVKEENFKNNKIIKKSTFSYNKEGLVSVESSESMISKQVTETRYKYDNLFRIKQIARTYPDGHVVYWESFLSDKGILTKEYYTLEKEKYIFLYNEFGQEISGEIREIEESTVEAKDSEKEDEPQKEDKVETAATEDSTNDKIKTVKNEKVVFKWDNTYIEKGLREQKVEVNFKLNKKIITNYNKDGKETKIQIFYDDVISSIEYYDYDDEKRIIYYKIIQDLSKNETFYKYNDAGDVYSTRFVENGIIKKEIINHPQGVREEIIYTGRQAKISKKYDSEGNLIK